MNRIVFVINDISSPGGIERSLSCLSNVLVQKGNKVIILSLFRTNENLIYDFNPKVEIIYLTKRKLTGEAGSVLRIFYLLSILKSLKHFFKRKQFDFIIGESFPVCLALFLSGIRTNVISCEHVYYDYYSKWIRFIRAFVYRRFAAIIVLTKQEAVNFKKVCPSTPVFIIPNILALKLDRQADLSSKRIISVGRLQYQKGYDLLLQGAKNFFNKYPDWELHVFGEGLLRDELLALRDEYGLEKNVFFRGVMPDITQEYIKSSIYVLPSRYEGLPTVLVEAASLGLAIVAFNGATRASDILDASEAILVKNGDVKALWGGVEKMIAYPDLRHQYASNAKKIASDYSEEKIYSLWISALERVADDITKSK